jgi:hypothetical protein
MKQLTIFFDEELEQCLMDVSTREGISLNQAALQLLKKGAISSNMPKSNKIGTALDHLCGTWKQAEASEFEKSVAVFEMIDKELWS